MPLLDPQSMALLANLLGAQAQMQAPLNPGERWGGRAAGAMGNAMGGYAQMLAQMQQAQQEQVYRDLMMRKLQAEIDKMNRPEGMTPYQTKKLQLDEDKQKREAEEKEKTAQALKDLAGKSGYFSQFDYKELTSPELMPDVLTLLGEGPTEKLLKMKQPEKAEKRKTIARTLYGPGGATKEIFIPEDEGEYTPPKGWSLSKAEKGEKPEKPEVKPHQAYNAIARNKRTIAILKNRNNLTDAVLGQLIQANPDLAGLMRGTDQASIDEAINALEQSNRYYEQFVPKSSSTPKETPKPSGLESFRMATGTRLTKDKFGKSIVPDPNSPSGYSYAD